eukprot:CAMPEP_0113944894 /NCGR_PEP_ID=MMETSP1339-20121228/37580_1 /TAXON_ID=94617 /ORGANISM="Fibrocapsa japonica" /LENGTH=173 /DNA_ID=CAMNT_0000950245 /DNA_START=50 /DNA_END=568 /DNA_ORIENTATION=+ /assembly_acc=CAM_ASM_000762
MANLRAAVLAAVLLSGAPCQAFLSRTPNSVQLYPQSTVQLYPQPRELQTSGTPKNMARPSLETFAKKRRRGRTMLEEINEIDEDVESDYTPTSAKVVEPDLKDKLVSEATAPFRKVRLFVYAACAVGATIAAYTALSQLLAALSSGDTSLLDSSAPTGLEGILGGDTAATSVG